jgi:hypothetical protein
MEAIASRPDIPKLCSVKHLQVLRKEIEKEKENKCDEI